jgi:hypothetical protein
MYICGRTCTMDHKIPLNYVSSANSVPGSSRKHGKKQVFLQTLSELPATIQPKQHAFARALVGTLQTGYFAYKLKVKTKSRACVHAPPRVAQSSGSHLQAQEGSSAAKCSATPDPTAVTPRGPAIDIFLYLGGGHCRTHWQ